MVSSGAESGWYHEARKAFVPVQGRRLFYCQHAETGFQLCSRLENILNVPERVRLRCFLRLGPRWNARLSMLEFRRR
jgi:hypothetical protein